ncbi:RNA-binding (RRM/RBD/RNP motifs) family protein [Raphanus sativus]|nr:RNA-binding (RRM/RBD/RNP motifs) family protein [Raphanus sativus]
MGNLPFDVKDEEVYQLLTGKSNLENNVEAVRVIRDPHLNIGKDIAYVIVTKRIVVVTPVATGKANLSYQGLRASKSGDDKKKPSLKSPAQSKMRPRSSSSRTEGNKANSSSNSISAVKQRSGQRLLQRK